MDLPTNPGPARPEKLSVEFYETPDSLLIRKHSGKGPQCFLTLWLIGWTVGCIALIVGAFNDRSLLVFGIPFWASWFAVASFLAWLHFGTETLLVRADSALFTRTAIVRLSSRAVPRSEIVKFHECPSKHLENDQHLWGIEMVTLGKPVRFAFRLPDRERAWLVYQLNRFLGIAELDAADTVAAPEKPQNPAATAPIPSEIETSPDRRRLTLADTLAEPPSDCSWSFVDDVSEFSFVQRGQWHLVSLGGLLFINLFWNGIVSVFLCALFGIFDAQGIPQGWEWWGMFVFLIPFEVIGLCFFVGLVLVAADPLRRTIWRIETNRITRQNRWPLIRHTKSWDVISLDRLELRTGRETPSRLSKFATKSGKASLTESEDEAFALAFVSSDNTDFCVIDKVTEAEARWMARFILERRPRWFAQSPS